MVAAQFGVVTRAQLLAAGVGSKGISLRVRDGRAAPAAPGVYAVGHTVLVPKGRTLAAVLSSGEAALSYTSATALHEVREEGPRTHVSVPRSGPHSRPGIVVHRTRRLDPEDITTIDGIRVTTIARTRRRRSARTARISTGRPPGSSSRPTAEPTTSAAPPSSATGNATSTSPPAGSRHSA